MPSKTIRNYSIILVLLACLLAVVLPAMPARAQSPTDQPASTVSSVAQNQSPFVTNFLKDKTGNTVAVIVLAVMVISLIAVAVLYVLAGSRPGYEIPRWLVPLLCVIGLVIAGYLSYTELTESNVTCGPLHGCNTVQASPYSKLLGFLPVGVFGVMGYLALLVAWLVQNFGPASYHRMATLALWAMAIFGVLFAAYLTFLEPFIIGATCTWCIGNAIVMTLVLWATSGPGLRLALE